MRAENGEKERLCKQPNAIENDLLRQLVRLYERGSDFSTFWEVVDRVGLFVLLKKNVCEERSRS